MQFTAPRVQRTYLTLLTLSTLASALIWGVNTLFLLDAGLSNTEAFAANAFFTAGQVIFEIPTGIVADAWGRRTSYLLGCVTLSVATLAYYFMWQAQAPLWQWGIVSVLLGLGFTFFSGAVEAWLVDALHFTKFKGELESVFAKGQMVSGAAMLSGSVAGGYLAQVTDLGVPFLVRSALLALTLIVAYFLMYDIGFTPDKSQKPVKQIKGIFRASVKHGLKNPPVRWLMFANVFTSGVLFYVFYALQPYLLELYGNPDAYGIAGLAAAIVAGAQIGGGMLVPLMRKRFTKRTSLLIWGVFISSLALLILGLTNSFWLALIMVSVWGLVFSATLPVRQAFINSIIPSQQRATVLSFDSLMGSTGAVFIQPALGKVADVYSYAASFLVAAGLQLLAIPFTWLTRIDKSSKVQNAAEKAE